MVRIKYFSTSTLTRQKRPIVKLPGKPVARAIQTGFFPSNKEIQYADFEKLTVEKRVTYKNKKLKLTVPTMASEHWVTLTATWQCVLERFTDPESGEEQRYWYIDYLNVSSYPIECASMYSLSATVQMIGQIKTMNGAKGPFPKTSFKVDFESIGPTGAKTKTKQLLVFEFIKGKFRAG